MSCKTNALKVLRDEHNFTPAELKIAKEFFANEEEDLRVGDQNDHDVQTYLREQRIKTAKEHEANLTVDALRTLGSDVVVEYTATKMERQQIKKIVQEGDTFVLTTNKATYRFLQGQDVSNETAAGRIVTIAGFGNFTNQVENGRLYGSDMDSSSQSIDWTKYDKIGENINKDPAKMLELLEELHALSGNLESPEQMTYLRDLLQSMKPKFFKDLNVYLQKGLEKNSGVITSSLTRIALHSATDNSTLRNDMGLAEVYAHELVHAITAFAIEEAANGTNREARRLVRELQHVMTLARKEIRGPEKLMPENATAEEKALAEEQYKYIFESEHSTAEFVAFALTNPKIRGILDKMSLKPEPEYKGLLDRIMKFFRTITEILLGDYERKDLRNTLLEQTTGLATRLAEIHAKHIDKAKASRNFMDYLNDSIDAGEEFISEALTGVINKFKSKDSTLKPLRPDASKTEKVLWTMRYFHKVMFNETYRAYFGLMMSNVGILGVHPFKPEGVIRDWLRAFTEAQPIQKAVEWLGTAADAIDRARNTTIGETKRVVLDSFHRKLTEQEETELKEILLDADVQSLLDLGYSQAKIRELLESPEKLTKAIGKAKHKLNLADGHNYEWNVDQAHGLGYFMATGEGHVGLNQNAVNIARGLLSGAKKKPTQRLIRAIDEVATLTALSYMSDSKKSRVAAIMLEESKYGENSGVMRILNLQKHFVEDSKRELFGNSTTHMIKGYSREIFDDMISVEIAPLRKQKEMANQGYDTVIPLEKVPGDSSSPMAMYVSHSFMTTEYLRAATRLTGLHRRGTTIEDIKMAENVNFTKERIALDKAKIDAERLRINRAMKKGTFDVNSTAKGMMPVLNEQGDVVTYRYMMNKKAKADLLRQNNKLSDVMAKSYGSVLDKQMTKVHNKKVLELVQKWMEDDWIEGTKLGKSGDEYILIGPHSTDEAAIEIYKVLPGEFKAAINAREDKVIAVPRKLMHMYFGFRHLSIVDFPWLKDITPAYVLKAVKIVETMWIEAVKILKGNILMKMPFILVANIMSNIMFALMTGEVNPIELLKDYTESYRDIREYISNDRELAQLKAKIKTQKNGKLSNADLARMKELENNMKNNPIHELMEIGVYSSINEDVDVSGTVGTNKWKKVIDDKLDAARVPQAVRTALQVLYLSEETKWYKINQEVLQISDLLARAVENRRQKRQDQKVKDNKKSVPVAFLRRLNEIRKEAGTIKNTKTATEAEKNLANSYMGLHDKPREEKRGVYARELTTAERKYLAEWLEKTRHYKLLENYINYNKPASRIEEYLNRVAQILFTKYTKSIQKIIATTAVEHPIKSVLSMLGQSYLYDVETIQDQSLFVKSLYNFGLGDGDNIPGLNMYDQFMDIIIPALVKKETYQFVP